MRVGIVGLGRMGTSLAGRAVAAGHEVVGFDPSEASRSRAEEQDITTVADLADLAGHLEPPRVVLIYVPHGDPVDSVLEELAPTLEEGDVVVDGGNSHWEDSVRRGGELADRGLRYLDMGTSGGTSQALGWRGAAFMVGGDKEAFDLVRPLLESVAVDEGAVYHAGPSGAGHFVKLVHNAIEFGMIQAIAEGVELLVRSDYDLDLPGLFDHWTHGTVIRGWLVELMGNALRHGAIGPDKGAGPELEELSTYVEDTGEVKWVTSWAQQRDIPVPVVALSQQLLMAYRDLDWPAAKAVALLRNQFGEHPVHRDDDTDRRN